MPRDKKISMPKLNKKQFMTADKREIEKRKQRKLETAEVEQVQ